MKVVHEGRRCAGDTGAAMAEAAFITPLFFFLLFGILDYGLVFRDYLTIGNTSVAGARMGSIKGNDKYADFEIINAVIFQSGALNLNSIKRLVVFKASGATDTISTACRTMTAPGVSAANSCNAYTVSQDWNPPTAPAALQVYKDTYYAPCVAPGRSRGWCPINRNVAVTSNSGAGPDYLGVYFEINHVYSTGLFGTSKTMSDQTISQLEPQKVA